MVSVVFVVVVVVFVVVVLVGGVITGGPGLIIGAASGQSTTVNVLFVPFSSITRVEGHLKIIVVFPGVP